jgi:hypothetical protein
VSRLVGSEMCIRDSYCSIFKFGVIVSYCALQQGYCRVQDQSAEWDQSPGSGVEGTYLYFVLLFQIMGSRVEGTCTVVVSNTGFCSCIRICICMHCNCICIPYNTFCDWIRCTCVITSSFACFACFVSVANVFCRFLANLVRKVDYRNFTGLSSR